MRYIRSLLYCLVVLGLLAGCGYLLEDNEPDSDDSGDNEPKVQAPQVISFEASPDTVLGNGEAVTLSWEVSGTDVALSISPEPGTVTGTSVAVTPDETTTYTLTATNAGGSSSKDVLVYLKGDRPGPDEPAPDEPDPNDPEPPTEPPEDEPLDLTGSWKLTAPERIYNDCPLEWTFELTQTGDKLSGRYDFSGEDPNEDPLFNCSSNPDDGYFNSAVGGSIDDDGTITLTGDYIYGADYSGPSDDYMTLEATVIDADTLSATVSTFSPGGGRTPFTATATMQRLDSDPSPSD